MEQTKEVAVIQQQENEINIFGSVQGFEIGQRMAKVFAQSTLVPQAYQGNVGNCLIGLNMAARMHADPLMVFQNLVIVHGTPTFEAKFAIACFNATGKYTPIRYEEIGNRKNDTFGMYAYALDKATGDMLKGPEITIQMAKEEGWFGRNPKWKTIPQLMLRYRAASWFIRTTDPGVMMGFQTREEVEDCEYSEITSDNTNENSVEEKLVQAQEQEQKEANTQTLDMNIDKEEQSNDAQEAPQSDNVTPKTQPLGKQEMPDMFKVQ